MDGRKSIEAKIKRAESTAKTYKSKGDRLYARYKNYDKSPLNLGESKEYIYLQSQQCYDKAKEQMELAERLKRDLK